MGVNYRFNTGFCSNNCRGVFFILAGKNGI